MTLPAAKPISMSQVRTELGRAGGVATSLNESAVRTLFGIPSGAISLSNGLGKSANLPTWATRTTTAPWSPYSNTAQFGYRFSAVRAPSGNVYFMYQSGVLKLSSTGAVLAHSEFQQTNGYWSYTLALVLDSSENVYVLQFSETASVVKLNSSLVKQWESSVFDVNNWWDNGGYPATISDINTFDLCIDPAGYIHCTYVIPPSNNQSDVCVFIKIDCSTGNIVSARDAWVTPANPLAGARVSYQQSSGVVSSIGGNGNAGIIINLPSDYSSISVYSLSVPSGFTNGVAGYGTRDASANYYFSSFDYGAYGLVAITKLDSTRTPAWTKKINYSAAMPFSAIARVFDIYVDASGNVFFTVESANWTGSLYDYCVFLTKLDSSGNHVFTKKLTISGGNGLITAVGPTNFFVNTGRNTAIYNPGVMTLRLDGSNTDGTYDGIVMSSITPTISTMSNPTVTTQSAGMFNSLGAGGAQFAPPNVVVSATPSASTTTIN